MLKVTLFSLVLVIIMSTCAFALPNDISCAAFSSFSSCIESPKTAGKTIIIEKVIQVSTKVIPMDRKIRIRKGGGFDIHEGHVLTFTQDPIANNDQIYFGPGVVNGLKETTPEHFGARGDGKIGSAAENTNAFHKMADSGAVTYRFSGSYFIKGPDDRSNNAVMKWKRAKELRFIFNNTKFINITKYQVDDKVHAIFEFEGCTDVDMEYFEYLGQFPWTTSIDDRKSGLGYVGETVIYFHSASNGLKVSGAWKNARYGILSGSYANPVVGNCSSIKAVLTTDTVGYAVALYLVDMVDLDISAVTTHRAVYLAGVRGGTVRANFKNQHIAPVQVILTDAKVSGTEPNSISRGCSDLNIFAKDTGSTVYVPNSYAAGIALSRVDKGTKFSNINFDIQIVGTDTTAATMAAFLINSIAKSYQPSYPYNWDKTITLENITVTGFIDRRSQSVSNHATGDVVLRVSDSAGHSATIKNLSFDNFRIYGGTSVTHRGLNMVGLDPSIDIKFINSDFSTVKNTISFPQTAKIFYENTAR